MKLTRRPVKTTHHALSIRSPAGVTAPPVFRYSPRSIGVALVITLILISVITFLAITFLALSRRESGQVTTTTDQSTARLAADSGQDRAMAELLATILANTNAFQFDLLVSTNFINPFGYDPAAVDFRTNVNFEYQNDGSASPLTANQALENLTHLLYNPRPPVFIAPDRNQPSKTEFRYYLDLNRDGQPTRTGWLVVTNPLGGFYNLSGFATAPFRILPNEPLPAGVRNQYFVGDPEFIGIQTRPEFPHSPTNRFLSRYAYLVVPAGKTLDVNYIHNAARIEPRDDLLGPNRFRRNQGVGGWENNLASFLVDLNTNAWPGPFQVATTLGSPYEYYPDLDLSSGGSAFEDAQAFLRYRFGSVGLLNNYSFLRTYDANRAQTMWRDGTDAYALSPIVSNTFGLFPLLDEDQRYTANTLWSGSEKPYQLFTTQDYYDKTKTQSGLANGVRGFTDRLFGAQSFIHAGATVPSSYNSYTFYRLLSQLGTDSQTDPDNALDPRGKLNVNFINLPPFRTTNFVSWRDPRVLATFGRPGSELFFRNAVDRLLRRYSADWLSRSYDTYTNVFRTNRLFGADRIPVFVNGQFTYPSSLHRQLQLAANLWDAVHGTNDALGVVPTVFRPQFHREGLDLYITNFVEVTSADQLTGTLRDLSTTNVAANVQPNDMIFGIPLVIGARKGLPNFNEFASEAVVQITRKVELVKRQTGGASQIFQTNQMLSIGISNTFGAEFWNSYAANYRRPVIVEVTNFYSVSLTNDYNFKTNTVFSPPPGGRTNLTVWPGYPKATIGGDSFVVPLRSNHIVLAESVYRQSSDSFIPWTRDVQFERPSGFAFPRWGLSITNRLLAVIKDAGTRRILDYVLLNGLTSYRDLAAEVAEAPPSGRTSGSGGFDFLWATNSPDPAQPLKLGDFPGVFQQILVSGGEEWGFPPGENWENNGINQRSSKTRDQAIAEFLAFFENSGTHIYEPNTGGRFVGTNYGLVATVPFTPTKKFSIRMFWQANDPLVHYTSGDLEDLESNENLDVLGIKVEWTPPSLTTNTVENLGKLNRRYKPWGGNPLYVADEGDRMPFNPAVKDPSIYRSDSWQFPTNRLPSLGSLGRIHRGTPWQTVYLKSTRAEDALNARSSAGTALNDRRPNDWQKWSGNRLVWRNGAASLNDAYLTQPEQDRNWLEVFTTALNESATRGQLPINQNGLAAWSAVFGGMLAVTNTSTDEEVFSGPSAVGPLFIEPAGVYDLASGNRQPPLVQIVEGINNTRTNRNLFPNATFTRLGDVLATPQLSEASPFLNFSAEQKQRGLTDPMIEWLPQQMLSLVRLGEPRFVIYSFGQTLKPAPRSIQLSGPYSQLCTNYQITAEVATRAVVRVVGSPDPRQTANSDPDQNYPPRIVVESFNVLPPD